MKQNCIADSEGIVMGKNSKGTVSGSYGDWAIIETPPVKITKVSCQMCRHYDVSDHSCAPGALGPKDSIRRWEKCMDFVLNPDYIWVDILERIKSVKGNKYLEEMLEISKKYKVDLAEYHQKKRTVKTDPVLPTAQNSEDFVPVTETRDTPAKTKLEGDIYEYQSLKGIKRRCIIVSQDEKYYCLRFEDGKEAKFDKKVLVKSHRLKKL